VATSLLAKRLSEESRGGGVYRLSPQPLLLAQLHSALQCEVAANASTNRHDFLVELEQALKRQAAGVETDRPVSEMEPEAVEPGEQPMPELRLAGQDG